MTARNTWDVIVAGHGVVGAVTALGLAQRGYSVAWVGMEAAPSGAWDPDARVVALSPASRDLLQALRVWDAVPADRVAPVYDMRVFAGARPQAPALHLDAYTGCVEALAWIVDVPALLGPLHAALRFAGVQTVADRVERLEPTAAPAERVAVGLAGGSVLQARLLIAADGADSTVRRLAGIAASVHHYPQRAWVAAWQGTQPHADTAWQWFDEAWGVLALLPLPSPVGEAGRVSMVWSMPDAQAQTVAGWSPQDWAGQVTQLSQGVLGPLTPLSAVRSFPLRQVKVARLLGPRVVLVGDAAHVMHPLAGQGLNVGLGDVACLLQVLDGRESYRDLGDALLWRRYERGRRAAVGRMQTLTDGLQRVFSPLPWPLGPLRDLGWRAVGASHGLRRQLIAQAVRF